MNLKIEELKRILSWFDIAESNLGDKDLVLYDSIKEYINDFSYDSEENDSIDSENEDILEIDYDEDPYDSDDYE